MESEANSCPMRKALDHRGPLSIDVSGAWYFITICAALAESHPDIVRAFAAYVAADGNFVQAAHLAHIGINRFYREWSGWLAIAREVGEGRQNNSPAGTMKSKNPSSITDCANSPA